MKKFESISKYIDVNYNHGEPEIAIVMKNMEKPMINVPEVPEYTSSSAEIFILENITKNL